MAGTPSLSPREWHQRAIAAEQRGAKDEAERIIAQGLGEHPNEAPLHDSAGNFAMRRGEYGLAAERFAAAARLSPSHLPFAINLAIAQTQADAPEAALAALAPHESAGRRDARYCSTRANAARLAGDLAQAARWYDQCLTIDAHHPRGLAGRARVALERAERDALARIDLALRSQQSDPHLWLSRAQALDATGHTAEARALAQQIADQAPSWQPGLDFLAQLRLGAGESDFASHFEDAARKAPGDPNIAIAHIAALGAAGAPLAARERATAARAAFPGIEQFALLEAVYASAVGDDERAERATAALSTDNLDHALHEARHALRRADWAGAEAALARAREFAPFDVSAWALTGLLWRVTDPEKAAWLHEQEGLVQLLPLADSEEVMPPAIALLGRLHDTSAFPLGQSLRGGTQTRGILFDRTEPALADLKRAILSTVGTYRESLPERDASHPLLRHCSGEWRLNGSWSVRLRSGGDHHAPHIHPQGILSSALYLMLPPPDEDGSQGTLELGRPAPDLRLDLPPLHRIAPKEGHLALFPSTLYHGTTSFGSGMRMTAAFDVIARGGLGDGTDDDGSRLE
ncbi:putative 2OG-Fe(II) oxygenase [Citromicrobium bathyomarinum]